MISWPVVLPAQQRDDTTPPRAELIVPAERLALLEDWIGRQRRRLGLPGLAVGVATADSVLLAVGFGGTTLAGDAIRGSTPFLIGSVTKTLTASAIAAMTESGELTLDAPIESSVPDFTLGAPFRPGSITARHLLTHRSGLRQWSGHDRRAQHTGEVAHIAPRSRPDLRAEYSSLNFMLLGRMLEATAGVSYAEVLRNRVLQPAGMHDAIVSEGRPWPTTLAAGHQSYFGIQVRRREPIPPPFLVSAGFVGASANDLARFGGMLVGGGAFGGARVLRPETVAEILGPRDSAGPALGWGRTRASGTLVLEHAGNARTSSARVRLLPDRGYAIAVLTNTNAGPFFPATADLADGIERILEGNEPRDLLPRERIFKGVVLVGTAYSLFAFARRAREWDQAGRPMRLNSSTPVLAPLTVDVVSAGLLLLALPRYLGVPLGTLHAYFPDLGIALTTSAGLGVAGGLLRAWTRAAR